MFGSKEDIINYMNNEFKAPLISIIIPAHNEENYIEKTILSIIDSSYKNYELIIVCDSCSDKTEEISKKYTDKVYEVDFKNIAQTRNFGASKAIGEIFVFWDADTISSDNYLASIVEVVNSGFDYGCSKMISETGTLKGRFIVWRINCYGINSKTTGGNFFIKKNIFDSVNGFDRTFNKGEDTELGERLYKSGAKYKFMKNSYIIPSERRWQNSGYFNYFLNSLKESALYFLNKKKYKKVIKYKVIDKENL